MGRVRSDFNASVRASEMLAMFSIILWMSRNDVSNDSFDTMNRFQASLTFSAGHPMEGMNMRLAESLSTFTAR